MIIWINGAFGIGKTQTAYELSRKIEGAHIFDPEHVGFFLAKQIPRELRLSDFQDYPLWRTTVSNILEYLQKERDKVIIVPMTVVSKSYFKEILEPLLQKGISVRNFTLTAEKKTIQARLAKRGDKNAWNYHQIDRCISGLQDPFFKEFLNTDENNLYEIVSLIGKKINITLKAIPETKIQRFLRRLHTTLKHIRI